MSGEDTLRQQRGRATVGNTVKVAGECGYREVTIAEVVRTETFAGYGRTRLVTQAFVTTDGETVSVRKILL